MWKFAWRVAMGLHKAVTVNFLDTGHAKFAPDGCLEMLKKSPRRHAVSSLKQMANVGNARYIYFALIIIIFVSILLINFSGILSHSNNYVNSVSSPTNTAQLVGHEDFTAIVPNCDRQAHLVPYFKPLPGIKKSHYWR